MTARDPGEIEARLAAAAAAPWRIEQHDLSLFVHSADEGLEANLGYVGNRPHANAEFIAAAPADVAYLLTELRKRDDALARVEAECAGAARINSADPNLSEYDRWLRARAAAVRGEG